MKNNRKSTRQPRTQRAGTLRTRRLTDQAMNQIDAARAKMSGRRLSRDSADIVREFRTGKVEEPAAIP